MISQENGDAVIVGDFSENGSHRRLIIDLAEKARLPTMYPERLYAEQGGLMSYGVNSSDVWRRAGFDVGQILQGAKPSDIPIYQPTRFELVINLKTARALGLQMPPIILTGADEVIE